MSLCYRCDHRLRFLEHGKPRPRYECGQVKISMYSCYMFRPQRPIVVERDSPPTEDPRPLAPGMLSCRFHMVKECEDAQLTLTEDGALYWELS